MLMAHHFYRQGEIVLIFLLYLQAKLAGVFQRWSIFLLCFSLCLFLRQLTSPKWICAIHHSLTELGEQFHYSLALFLCSTTKMSKLVFFFLNLLSPLNKMGAGNKTRDNEGLLLALEAFAPWRQYQQSDLELHSPSVWAPQFLKTSASSEGAKQLAVSSLEHLATRIYLFAHLFHFSKLIYKPGNFLCQGKITNKINIGVVVDSFPLWVIWLFKPLFLLRSDIFGRAKHFCQALCSLSTCC